jgi:hypothetical protein
MIRYEEKRQDSVVTKNTMNLRYFLIHQRHLPWDEFDEQMHPADDCVV